MTGCMQGVKTTLQKEMRESQVAVPTSQQATEEDDWNLPMEFHLFASHDRHSVYLPSGLSFEIECVERLTPLDMMTLSSGVHDATGHCAWMGSFLLVAAVEELTGVVSGNVLELGCGTGIGGLALLHATLASLVCFTDADPNALELCRRNCELNELDKDSWQILQLYWGDAKALADQSFDCVLATDVLYDIGVLPALFSTACTLLSRHRPFVLSHVPRACYNSEHPPVSNLEEYIVERAQEYGFRLALAIRPVDLMGDASHVPRRPPSHALNAVSLDDMQEVGAAILVFQKV